MRDSQNGHTSSKLETSNSSKTSHIAARPKIADLFAGVGGFSLGAARAGFEVRVAIDLDPHAIAAHKKNFPSAEHSRRNIANLTGNGLLRLAKLDGETLAGIIGGPPCQGFSTMGRRRKNDSRNPLFFHFFRLIAETKPVFFVAENVPGILSAKYQPLLRKALGLISEDYRIIGPFTLCASAVGAATIRSRVFFVGVLRTCPLNLSEKDFTHFAASQKSSVKVALAGLTPSVKATWQREQQAWRRVKESKSEFFVSINRFCESVGDPMALERFTKKLEVSGFFGTRHEPGVLERFATVPAGKTDKVSKFPRLRWDGLCRTRRAGTDSRRGSYQAARPLHPVENRVITPREAARLQGFPDWFQFSSTKWHSFRQIGNSLSPFVAEHLMNVLARALRISP